MLSNLIRLFAANRMRLGGESSSAPPSPRDVQAIKRGVVETGSLQESEVVEQNDSNLDLKAVKIETDGPFDSAEKQNVPFSKGSLAADPASDLDLSRSMWTPIFQHLEDQLHHHAWEIRHGSALALQDLIRLHGGTYGMKDNMTKTENLWYRERYLGSLAAALLEMLAVDRFGDFVGDQVVAPVREAGSQALACLLQHMGIDSIAAIHTLLLRMILQDWSAVGKNGAIQGGYAWEVRHAGLLGLKYELAVRPDLITDEGIIVKGLPAKSYIQGVLQGSLLG
jgi:TATA-binding protein-associated factor